MEVDSYIQHSQWTMTGTKCGWLRQHHPVVLVGCPAFPSIRCAAVGAWVARNTTQQSSVSSALAAALAAAVVCFIDAGSGWMAMQRQASNTTLAAAGHQGGHVQRTVQVVWCVLCCLMVRESPRSASFAVKPQGDAGFVVTSTLRAFCNSK